ncbi:MAG: aconitate hydratase AcnA [Bacteroidetes bacterium]|nr:aconitate hydratase AcnA [Bacteroidota bacterium]
MKSIDSFHTQSTLTIQGKQYTYYSLPLLEETLGISLSRLPFSIRILLENLLRKEDGRAVTRSHIETLARWSPSIQYDSELSFMPGRVLLQDFTGVPCVVDLAVMRDAVVALGEDPSIINPLHPVDLVIDHSLIVDEYGTPTALHTNTALEFQRNKERYIFLKWGQQAFKNFRVIPPGTGIIHQVNLEYLATVVTTEEHEGELFAYPDTVVGTDSHTTMINGLGVLGWGVGGIEAEAVMLGQPIAMLIPQVVGVKLVGKLPAGTTATDLVLTVTQTLRKKGVVGKFVEFYGDGLNSLSLSDRATIANMAPEYGATTGFFPVDNVTIEYLRLTGRNENHCTFVETYLRSQHLFRTSTTSDPEFSETVTIDLSSVEPGIAGPKRPHDRIPLTSVKQSFRNTIVEIFNAKNEACASETIEQWIHGAHNVSAPPFMNEVPITIGSETFSLKHGDVVIAAITSCTNTSNPSVLIAAGLLAQKALTFGLRPKPWVKTSFAPGSKVVTQYLERAGLLNALEQLGFFIVGYGCTTCIGNSGPLPEPIANAIQNNGLVTASVLSGNRNFEGRVHPLVRINYLASPPLVVAYALAGTVNIDFMNDPIGKTLEGRDIYLKDIYPTDEEINTLIRENVKKEMFTTEYANVFSGNSHWQELPIPTGMQYQWNPLSTYIKPAPYFQNFSREPHPLSDIRGARVLIMLGDSITTDHISPAGSFSENTPAGQYLLSLGIQKKDFNQYGTRRGNHEVMMRGTFANIRIKNRLVPGTEGGYTLHPSSSKPMSIFDAAMKYKSENVPLIVLAGKEYGSGSSRDWAAKGPALLGVKAVIAESFERIHRSNLIGMGILPLQFEEGENANSLQLTGLETYTIEGIERDLYPRKKLTVTATTSDGNVKQFKVLCRIDTLNELDYYIHGGVLPFVLRNLLAS